MVCTVCPWWLGYFLISSLRRWWQDPHAILAPHVRSGMTVLEPGPGMGFFSLELARLVGVQGRVVAVELQPKMLAVLRRRATNAGLASRFDFRQAVAETLGVSDLTGQVDFALAFAIVHELPDSPRFFAENHAALKPGGHLLLCEPAGHVSKRAFAATVAVAEGSGLRVEQQPAPPRGMSALLVRP